jgi:hypothetical protein
LGKYFFLEKEIIKLDNNKKLVVEYQRWSCVHKQRNIEYGCDATNKYNVKSG